VEGGDVGVGAHVSRGTSQSHRIGQRATGQRRERTLSLRYYDRPGHGSVHHVVLQRIQRKLEPEVRTPVRATRSGRIGRVLFVVDRAVRPHFTEQSRPDDVQTIVLGASARRGVGRRGRRVGRRR